jgi:membrane protease YdiL (CAAX protease family)
VPFWTGVLSALGATVIGFVVSFGATIVVMMATILATGKMPSTAPGHPLLGAMEVVFYAAGGAFAWLRLRAARRRAFAPLTGADVRVILLGIAALVVLRIGTVALLLATHQTKHVQTGFEHFDVVTKTPGFTAVAIVLSVVVMVGLGPIVEEIVFRGLLFGALAPRLGTMAGAIVTALLFGAVHGDPVLFVTLAGLGFVNALAYAATGNLWVPVTLHALNNALGAIVLIASSLNGTRG